MAQQQLLAVVVIVSSLSLLSPLTTASPPPPPPSGGNNGKPLVTAITRDAATKLYTAPLKSDGALPLPLVLDLSGPLVWSTCPAPHHPSYECHHAACARAHAHHPPGCPRTGHGFADPADPFRCRCTAHPYNPFARPPHHRFGSGDLTRTHLTANATDGSNPLSPAVSFTAVAACAPPELLTGLPAGAVGVAGLARSWLAFPSQVARKLNVSRKFALCLPGSGGGLGVAIFGGGPLFLLPSGRPDVTANLAGTTPLRGNPRSAPGYFVSATGIAVNQAAVQVHCPMVVALSTRVPYTVLRRDVYAPFLKAFDAATAGMKRVAGPAAAPFEFELCYDSRELGSTRLGYAVPQVDLMLEGGANWTVFGGNSMVQVSDDTACFAFLEMKEEEVEEKHGGHGGGEQPAVVIGGFQMENNLLVFDEEKGQLGFSGLLFGRQTTCSNFNFTLAA